VLTATKFDAVPFTTVTSLRINPVTALLKVKVTGIGEVFVGFGAVVDTITVGRVLSYVTVNVLDARLVFVATSSATPAAALTDTTPTAVGVTDAV